MRILLHPDLVPPQDFPEQIIEIPPPDRQLKLNVTRELFYLHKSDLERDERGTYPYHEKNRAIRRAVEQMRKKAPEDKKFQDDGTLAAQDRMQPKHRWSHHHQRLAGQ